MSLRSFHIFFIVMASLMSCGIAYIEYVNWRDVGAGIHLAGCCASIVAAIGLLVYAVFFFRKTKRLES